jgi:hypothetical protein
VLRVETIVWRHAEGCYQSDSALIREMEPAATACHRVGGRAMITPSAREEPPMADLIISKSKTKEAVTECNVSGEFYDALDAKVRELIKNAEKRAVANGRKTVRSQDL